MDNKVVVLEGNILRGIKNIDEDEPYFKSLTNDFDIAELKTDFNYNTGINPYLSGENSLYEITIRASNVLILTVQFMMVFLI